MSVKRMKSGFKAILIIIIILMVGVAGFCGYKVYTIQSEYNAGDSVYEGTASQYAVSNTEKETELTPEDVQAIVSEQQREENPSEAESDADKETEDIRSKLRVKYIKPKFVWDYMRMHTQYPDVVGYIYQEDTMSYPILKGETNDTYLRTMINGEYNVCGSIFVDSNRNLYDNYSVVYGHNVKNGAMFGSLLCYRDPEYWKEHPYFDIYSGMLHYRYYVFAVCTSPVDKDVYNYGITEPEPIKNPDGTVTPVKEIELKDFAKSLKERSDYEISDFGLGEFKNSDHIICLSTCTYNLDYSQRYTIFLRRAFRYSK